MAVAVESRLAKREISARSRAFLAAARARIGTDLQTPKTANWHRAFFELYRDLPLRERQARATALCPQNPGTSVNNCARA